MQTDERLSTAEVATLAGVTVATVCRWAKTGILRPATRLPGGRMTFRRSDVIILISPTGVESAEATA